MLRPAGVRRDVGGGPFGGRLRRNRRSVASVRRLSGLRLSMAYATLTAGGCYPTQVKRYRGTANSQQTLPEPAINRPQVLSSVQIAMTKQPAGDETTDGPAAMASPTSLPPAT